jgi:hypothetical protein
MLDMVVICEGQTEREFCRQVVAPYAASHGVALAGTLVGKPQRKRGGIRDWAIYRTEILRLAKERTDRHLAVLVDYYAMPVSWPGRISSKALLARQKGQHVEDALRAAMRDDLLGRFHPCVQVHEFESLLFVDPPIAALSIAVGGGVRNYEQIAKKMQEIRTTCGSSVEDINDSEATAPSKRIIQLVPGYDKVAWGVTAAGDISLRTLKDGCPWLDRWLSRIAVLAHVPDS